MVSEFFIQRHPAVIPGYKLLKLLRGHCTHKARQAVHQKAHVPVPEIVCGRISHCLVRQRLCQRKAHKNAGDIFYSLGAGRTESVLKESHTCVFGNFLQLIKPV